jgi:alpha-beta hydrolase superfamily lysophospholipase
VSARQNNSTARPRPPVSWHTAEHDIEVQWIEQEPVFFVRMISSNATLSRASFGSLFGEHSLIGSVQLSPDGKFLAVEGHNLERSQILSARTLVLRLPSLERVSISYGAFAMQQPWSSDSNGLYLKNCGAIPLLLDRAHCHFAYLPLSAFFRGHIYTNTGDIAVFEEPESRLVFAHRAPEIASQGQLLILGRRDGGTITLLDEPLICSAAVLRFAVARNAIWALTLDHAGRASLIRFGDFDKQRIRCPTQNPKATPLTEFVGRISLAKATEDQILMLVNSPAEGVLYTVDKVGKVSKLLTSPRAVVTAPTPLRSPALLPAKVRILPDIGDETSVEIGSETINMMVRTTSKNLGDVYELNVMTVPSQDGARVPLSLFTRQKGRRPKATILNVYGAYNDVPDRRLTSNITAWLDLGYQYAICHTRGGGDLGDAWHVGGRGANKPNTVRDTIACAEALQRDGQGGTLIVLLGTSAGGIPAAGATLSAPHLFAATVLINPVVNLAAEYDAKHLDGADRAEFGTTNVGRLRSGLSYDPTEMALTSPRKRLPPILLFVSERDRLVPPKQSVHFAKILLEFQSPELVLVNLLPGLGHSISSEGRLQIAASIFAHVDALLEQHSSASN